MLDVTVVVAVYNPGADIDDLLASLDAQTHPRERWEVVLVDDGSTDGTGERLDAWCAERSAWASVVHIDNSGWPGRPRNVGTDHARGEFVLYVDNDDYLDPQAVELLQRRARRVDADVVVGKVVGHGKKVSWELFERSRREVDVSWPPLVRLLSPHKLFRRALLTEHGIRFPEGRARLEDHVFVLAAFFHARRISIHADHPIYHWMRRDSGGNQSFARMDAEQYFGHDVPRVLDVIDAHVTGGDEHDRLYTHWWRTKALWRLQGNACARRDPDHNAEIYAAVRRLMRERFPPRLDARLPFSLRVLAQLVRADRPEGIWALADYEARLAARLRLAEQTTRDNGTEIYRLNSRFGGSYLRLREAGGRRLWVPPEALAQHLDGIDLDVTDASAAAEVLIRRTDGVEHLLPATDGVRFNPVGDTGLVHPVQFAIGRLRHEKAASGTPLEPGEWQVGMTVRFAGFSGLSFKARISDGAGGFREGREPIAFRV